MLEEAYRDSEHARMQLDQTRKRAEEAERILNALGLSKTASTTTPPPSSTASTTSGAGGASADVFLCPSSIEPSVLSDFEKAVREGFREDRDLSYPTYSTTFVSKQAAKAQKSTWNTPSASPKLDARKGTSPVLSRSGPDSPPWHSFILNEWQKEDTKDSDFHPDDSNSDDSDDLSFDALSQDAFSPKKQDVSKHFR